MDQSLTRKIALVTGASRGIGLACADALAKAGYHVAFHYRSDSDLAHKMAGLLPHAIPFQADLSVPEDCQSLVKAITEKMGPIDVLVNSAGTSIDQLITFARPEDFDRLLATNLKPVFMLSKLVSRQMIRKKAGQIVNITSVVGFTGNAGQSMYSATKAAITAFTKSIALDLASFGIRCNCVAPGFIKTDMTDALDDEIKKGIIARVPMKRLGTAEEVGKVVGFLVSDQASYITGSTIHVNGGMFTN